MRPLTSYGVTTNSSGGTIGPASPFGEGDLGEDRFPFRKRDTGGAEGIRDARTGVVVVDRMAAGRTGRPPLDEAPQAVAGGGGVAASEPVDQERSPGRVLEVGERHPDRLVADRASGRVPARAGHRGGGTCEASLLSRRRRGLGGPQALEGPRDIRPWTRSRRSARSSSGTSSWRSSGSSTRRRWTGRPSRV